MTKLQKPTYQTATMRSVNTKELKLLLAGPRREEKARVKQMLKARQRTAAKASRVLMG